MTEEDSRLAPVAIDRGASGTQHTSLALNGDFKVVYSLTRDPRLQTRHLVVYNTGPAVGVDLQTLRRVFEVYGTVERLECPNPTWSRIYVSFDEIASAVRAKAERNRPPEVEEKVRKGVPRAAHASDVFAPKPGEPCPLLGRWLKVCFAEMRVRSLGRERERVNDTSATASGADNKLPAIPAHLKDFKALDALAVGGASAADCRRTPCPLCGRQCGGQRGLRMHLVNAHATELPDREHLVHLLKRGSDLLPPPPPPAPPVLGHVLMKETDEGSESGLSFEAFPFVQLGTGPPVVGGGAAAKGRAGTELSPEFRAARDGDIEEVRRLVEGADGGGGWDPKIALDKNGSGPLDWAAGEGRLEVCRYLVLECGVDHGRRCPNRGRGEGRTALHWAARGGHKEVCRFFLDTPRPPAGAPEDEEKEDVTACAGRVDVYLTPDVAAAEGTTPLHWACWGAHLATCRLLVSRGADHRKVNAHGCNVAHWCGLAGDLDVCSWLAAPVEAGGAGGLDWGKINLQGHTICHKAALKGHGNLLKWLKQKTMAGVVPWSAWGRDEGGYLPRDVARLSGHVDVADWLESDGIDLDAPRDS